MCLFGVFFWFFKKAKLLKGAKSWQDRPPFGTRLELKESWDVLHQSQRKQCGRSFGGPSTQRPHCVPTSLRPSISASVKPTKFIARQVIAHGPVEGLDSPPQDNPCLESVARTSRRLVLEADLFVIQVSRVQEILNRGIPRSLPG